MHFVFARVDYEHLAHGIPPFLIGFLTLSQVLQSKIKWSEYGIVALLFLTIFSVGIVGPFFQKAVSKPGSFVRCDINGDSLWLNRNMATYIKAVQDIESQRIAPGEGLLIVPWESGLYPILQRESPIWDIYLLTPEAEGKQNEMIDQLEQNNVKWILLHNSPFDGRDERRISHTHKILWDYFYKNYDPVECPDLMPYMKLLHRKTNKDSF